MVLSTERELQTAVAAARAAGRPVALVPTMGALHAGHLSLIQAAVAKAHENRPFVVVSVFVNPTQFAPGEDFQSYPRDPAGDHAAASAAGADVVFQPTVTEIYPLDRKLPTFPLPAVATRWEGELRPGHFAGVCQVVARLFQMSDADRAYFGEKDYQQLQVVRAMVRDSLHDAVRVIGCPTVREPDGLALSSRNRYLSADERRRATAISAALQWACGRVDADVCDAAILQSGVRTQLESAGMTVDYAAVVEAGTLEPLGRIGDVPARLLVAARLGTTRLIDNCALVAPTVRSQQDTAQ
ncbi:MAG: pantoate--beta-alanine ligase [Actinomycetes bacterium]|nr:pantoate--beta-alanine ligase [Actinomycetes bacterium]